MDLGPTLFGQMITFAIFVWFTMKFVWPLLEVALEERKKKISDGLAAAEKGHEELALANEKAKRKLKKTKEHCHFLILEAEKQREKIIEKAKIEARQERDDMLASGKIQLVQATHLAKMELQTQLAEIVVKGAEQLLKRSIKEADHTQLLDKLAKEMST